MKKNLDELFTTYVERFIKSKKTYKERHEALKYIESYCIRKHIQLYNQERTMKAMFIEIVEDKNALVSLLKSINPKIWKKKIKFKWKEGTKIK